MGECGGKWGNIEASGGTFGGNSETTFRQVKKENGDEWKETWKSRKGTVDKRGTK